MSAPARALAVVGASWGGFQAVGQLVAGLDERCALAVAVAQHRAPDAPADAYVRSIQTKSRLPVHEVEDKDVIEAGHVYVAPADYHLLIDDDHFALSTEGPVRFSRPSIDVLFETAAESFGERAIAVVLTGANDDGCRGALAIKEAGGRVYAQDPDTAERREMPDGVIVTGAVDAILPVPEIAAVLNRLGRVDA